MKRNTFIYICIVSFLLSFFIGMMIAELTKNPVPETKEKSAYQILIEGKERSK